jgi:hypothetical protein
MSEPHTLVSEHIGLIPVIVWKANIFAQPHKPQIEIRIVPSTCTYAPENLITGWTLAEAKGKYIREVLIFIKYNN